MARYNVVLSDRFIKKANEIEVKHPMIQESIRGASWRLSRLPKEGEVLGPPLSDIYRVATYGPPVTGFYRLWIYYKLEEDQNKITFVDLKVPD